MQNIITKIGLILALALFCQVKAQVSGSFNGRVPGGRPGPYEVGSEIDLQYDVPFGTDSEGYGPGGYQGYGGYSDSPVGIQGGYGRPIPPGNRPPGWSGGYYPDSFQGGNGDYYQGGRPLVGFGRPGRRPGFRPPGWSGNYGSGDGYQGGYYLGGRPVIGFGRPGRRPGYRPPVGLGWPNGFYPGNNFQGGYGGYFPGDRPHEGFFGSGSFYPVSKPQIENNTSVTEEKPTHNETINQAGESLPQHDLQEGAQPGVEIDDLPVFQGNTDGGIAANVNSL